MGEPIEDPVEPLILIIDDEPANLAVIYKYLSDQGFQVMVAQTGKTGLELARQEQPDLILLDVMLPGIDGFEACRRLKADDRTREIPVLFMTVLTRVEDKIKGFEAGGLDYITKPFQESEVLARVATHLKLRELTVRLEQKVSERTEKLVAANQHLREEIVERKRAEEMLHKYEYIVSSASDLMSFIDKNYIYQAVNKAYLEAHQKEREDIVAYSIADLHGDEVFERVIRPEIDKCLSGERIQYQAWFDYRGWGRKFVDVIYNPYVNRKGAIEGVVVSVRDVTEHKLADDALKESEQKLANIIDFLPDAMFGINRRGEVILWNKAVEAMTGINAEDILGKADYEHAIPFYGKRRPLLVDMVLQPEPFHDKEYDNIRKEDNVIFAERYITHLPGNPRFLKATSTPLYDPDGNIIGAIEILHDITHRKQAEEERKAQILFLENLERINQSIQRADNLERMLWEFIKTVFGIFGCDRAWLLYPCDPNAPTFRVPIEYNRPEYPGALELNLEVPMSPAMAQDCQEALDAGMPLTYTLGTESPVSRDTAGIFGVQAQMFMALHPKAGKAWLFGIHQCSHPRKWSKEEQNLFNEIGRRLSDGLSTMLSLREAKESQEELRKHKDHLEETAL